MNKLMFSLLILLENVRIPITFDNEKKTKTIHKNPNDYNNS